MVTVTPLHHVTPESIIFLQQHDTESLTPLLLSGLGNIDVDQTKQLGGFWVFLVDLSLASVKKRNQGISFSEYTHTHTLEFGSFSWTEHSQWSSSSSNAHFKHKAVIFLHWITISRPSTYHDKATSPLETTARLNQSPRRDTVGITRRNKTRTLATTEALRIPAVTETKEKRHCETGSGRAQCRTNNDDDDDNNTRQF